MSGEITFRYRNHKGISSARRVIPIKIEYKTSQWHKGQQWILQAYCIERNETRDFAMKDIVGIQGVAI